MNIKVYKDYEVEIRVTTDICEKYNISGKSNNIAKSLKQILKASQLNRDEYKSILLRFEEIVQCNSKRSSLYMNQEVYVTENAVLIIKSIFTEVNVIDTYRINEHGENVHEKRKKQIELSKHINQKRFKKAINDIKENIEKLKNSKVTSDILLNKPNSCAIKSTFSPLDCCDEKSIVINDNVIIELDDFVLHGKLVSHYELSNSNMLLSIYYTRVFDKHACTILEDINLLDDLVYNTKNIDTLEKLNDNLIIKLKSCDTIEKR